jgi:spore coat polysaccharide biosynthesis predicted glycosyltransferase SpsG
MQWLDQWLSEFLHVNLMIKKITIDEYRIFIDQDRITYRFAIQIYNNKQLMIVSRLINDYWHPTIYEIKDDILIIDSRKVSKDLFDHIDKFFRASRLLSFT